MRDRDSIQKTAMWIVGVLALCTPTICFLDWLTSEEIESEVFAGTVGVFLFLGISWWILFATIRGIDVGPVIAATFGLLLLVETLSVWKLHGRDFDVMFVLLGLAIFEVGLWGIYVCIPNGPRGLLVFGQIVGGIALLSIFHEVLYRIDPPLGAIGDFLEIMSFGTIYAFLRYRQGRQDELIQMLATAVSGQIPLAPVLRSYLAERPRRGKIRKSLMGLACLFLPIYTYVRLCIGWRRYDRLVENLADRLEQGEWLSVALRLTPGVAPREATLLVAIGEETRSLESCLRAAERERWTAAWLEVAPRFLYPLFVLMFVIGITTFLMIHIIPKYIKIFSDFGVELPRVTRTLIEVSYWADDWPVFFVLKLLSLIAISIVVVSPAARWHSPVLGRLYRSGVQAAILRALSRLFAVGRTVPQTLELLRAAGHFPPIVDHRIVSAEAAVARGRSLDEALERTELLPAAMAPLVRAAERARTLPWALNELGDQLAGRAFRLVRRFSLIAGPLLIVAVAVLVAFIALGMFLPLIQLISSLGE